MKIAALLVGGAAGVIIAATGVDLWAVAFPPPPWIEFHGSVVSVPDKVRAGESFTAQYAYRKQRNCDDDGVVSIEWWVVPDAGPPMAMPKWTRERDMMQGGLTGDGFEPFWLQVFVPEGMKPRRVAYWPTLRCGGAAVKPPPAIVEVIE